MVQKWTDYKLGSMKWVSAKWPESAKSEAKWIRAFPMVSTTIRSPKMAPGSSLSNNLCWHICFWPLNSHWPPWQCLASFFKLPSGQVRIKCFQPKTWSWKLSWLLFWVRNSKEAGSHVRRNYYLRQPQLLELFRQISPMNVKDYFGGKNERVWS